MLVPLAPSQRRAHHRGGSRTRGPGRIHRAARWAIGVLLTAGALLGMALPRWPPPIRPPEAPTRSR